MERFKDKFIVLLFSLNLFWASFYFSVSSIIGISVYENGAPGYTDGILVTGILSILAVIFDCKATILSNKLFTLIFPCFFLLQYLFAERSAISSQFFTYYVGFSIPASYVGLYIAKKGGIAKFTKWLDIIMIFITVGLILSFPTMSTGGSITNSDISFGGASYQQMAYMAGLAFTINLCGILFGESYDRFSFMKKKITLVVCYMLLGIQLLTCFYAGGRGGFIYLALCSSVLLLYSKKIKYLYYALLGFGVLYVLGLVYQGSILADIITERMERTFSFISSTGGIDTQNREDVWNYAEKLSDEMSFLGSGIFPYYHIFRVRFNQPYAHNLFLEFLIQGGILYLLFWIFLLCKGIKKLYNQLRMDEGNSILIIFFLFPFITLCFSSTYLQSSHLWFSLSYLFAISKYGKSHLLNNKCHQ